MKQPKEFIEELDEMVLASFPKANTDEEHEHNIEVVTETTESAKRKIKSWLIQSHIDRLEEEIAWLEGEKYTRKEYDGNDLKSACAFHNIAAEGWAEIIRLEDEHNAVLNHILTTKQAELSEWEALKTKE